MKIHPEMKELIDEEMREGLRYWRDKSPEEIYKRVRERLLIEQKVFTTPTKGIDWRWEYQGCDCAGVFGHYPWCTGKKVMVFFTPLPERKPDYTKDGRDFYFGHSPWGGLP